MRVQQAPKTNRDNLFLFDENEQGFRPLLRVREMATDKVVINGLCPPFLKFLLCSTKMKSLCVDHGFGSLWPF
jgi:hypothetical protein